MRGSAGAIVRDSRDKALFMVETICQSRLLSGFVAMPVLNILCLQFRI